MSAPAKRTPALPVTLSDEQLEQLATLVVQKLQAHQSDDTYDQDRLPTGLSRRVYLEAARAGAFPTRRMGRKVVCTREALDAWIAARSAKKPKEPKGSKSTKDEDVLRDIATVNGSRYN